MQYRYEVVITFVSKIGEKVKPMIEKCYTWKQAIEYHSLIDDTVYKAYIEDRTNGKITWLKNSNGIVGI